MNENSAVHSAPQSGVKPRGRLKWVALLILLLFAGGAALIYFKLRGGITPAARGERLAEKLGCFGCHGPGGAGGVPNPGALTGITPGWSAAAAAEYIKSPAELTEWIEDGIPRRLKEVERAENDAPLIAMPAYKGRIKPQQMADLLAYLNAVMSLDAPPESAAAARQGYFVAQKAGCFGCHGPSGRGLRGNPQSLAGYIPGWEGPIFKDLVQNDAELEDWIRSGITERMQKNPIASRFMQRQAISMPSYDGVLSDEEIARIIDYIHWLRGPADAGK